MEGLNSLSTFGAHPKDFDPEQVKPVLNNLATIIKWYQRYKDSQAISKAKTRGDLTFEAKTREDQTFSKLKTGLEKDEIKSPYVLKGIFRKSRISLILLLSLILVVVVIIAYSKMFRKDKLEKLRSSDGKISVAVMPFQNMTNDTTWNVWQDGIQEHLTNSLSNSQELKVRQTESIKSLIQGNGLTNYASITPSLASKFSQKLNANVFVYGNITQAGNTIRVSAQLIDSKTEEVFKSFQIEGSSKEENIFQIIDSLSAQVKNFLIISKLVRGISPDFQSYVSTNSPEAFRYFIYGQNAYLKRDYPTAVKLYSQAIACDSNFTFATLRLSLACRWANLYDQAKKYCLSAYEKKDHMPLQQEIYANLVYAICFETPYDAIKYIRELLEIDNQLPSNYYQLGFNYFTLYQYDKAIPEFEKALEIYNKWGSKPMWINNYRYLGLAYHKTGQYKKEKKLYKKAEQDFPDNPDLIYRQTILLLTVGDTIEANKYIEKYRSIRKENSSSEVDIMTDMANIYSEAGIPDKAEEYYRQAILLEPENPVRLNNLAYFLINNDRNINEGLGITDKAMELNPDNYLYLNTKGWGMYKEGNYKEALKILQKAWDVKPVYNHELFLHLEEVKKAIASQKNK
jgi:tetratricopeptide (TPR) repeat protein